MWLISWRTKVTRQPLTSSETFSFKLPFILASNINLTETTSRQARIPGSIPRLQTSGKGHACCKQQGCNQSREIHAQQHSLHCSSTSALLPRWRGLIHLCISPQRSGINHKYLRAALHYAQLPKAASSRVCPPAEGWRGTWGGERWGPGSTCSPAPPGCPIQPGWRHPSDLFFEMTICPSPKGTVSCRIYSFAEIKRLQRNTHYANISSVPHDTTQSTKHKQKLTKESAEALWKENHLLKSFFALLTAIRTAIMLQWLASPENWINWDTEETIESKETDSKNKWDNRWKTEMQCPNCRV